MLKKLWHFIKNQSNRVLFLLLIGLLGQVFDASFAHGRQFMEEKKVLDITDGRQLEIIDSSIQGIWGAKTLVLKRLSPKKEIIWSKTFNVEYSRTWDLAFFVPIKKNQYFADVNGDGFHEIAIANWNGYGEDDYRSAVIFTIKRDSVVFYKAEPFNIEYERFVFYR